MKKIMALVLAAMMLLACCSALAEAPEGYPEVKEGIDFGGKDIYIYDYWTNADSQWENWTEMDPDTQKTYDYRKWLEETYNCKIHQIQNGDWGTCAQVMIDFVANGGEADKLALFIVEPGKIGSLMTNGVAADWNYDFSADKWNKLDKDFVTIGGKTYGAYVGYTEPRAVLYFNKKVLEDAGIDPESIYDAQKDGTWTWEMFEDMLKKITRDTDNDGVIDIWGLTGSGDDMNNAFVFNNGGKWFDFDENGQLYPAMNTDNVMEALAEAKKIGQNYFYAQPADGNWDYYKEAFKAGNIGFYSYQCYGGLAFGNGSSKNTELADMEDDWGIVAFPVKEAGMQYITVGTGCDNITMIPSCYDEETVQKLAFIYDMWTNDTPGVDTETSWIGDKYDMTDDRAIDETYWMLLNNSVANRVSLLGTQNDVLGNSLLWQWLSDQTPAELIEAGMPAWQALCDTFNGK
jgi:hypothetical protein